MQAPAVLVVVAAGWPAPMDGSRCAFASTPLPNPMLGTIRLSQLTTIVHIPQQLLDADPLQLCA